MHIYPSFLMLSKLKINDLQCNCSIKYIFELNINVNKENNKYNQNVTVYVIQHFKVETSK
eukprot:GAHX01004878.1.p2 GENE.GAHX01004878.1~~GAHX01004878.1.p2  ORF type:complete len:60 (+),score=2.77 GAHX01004878.1:495-674(+)